MRWHVQQNVVKSISCSGTWEGILLFKPAYKCNIVWQENKTKTMHCHRGPKIKTLKNQLERGKNEDLMYVWSPRCECVRVVGSASLWLLQFSVLKKTTKKATRKSSLWPVKFTALFLLEVKLRYNSWVNRSVRVATGQYVVRGRRCWM